jgi:hypothetical protein
MGDQLSHTYKTVLKIILVEDIPLCLKYKIKMKQSMYSVCHNYLLYLSFQMLATSFGLNRPSSGHYL